MLRALQACGDDIAAEPVLWLMCAKKVLKEEKNKWVWAILD